MEPEQSQQTHPETESAPIDMSIASRVYLDDKTAQRIITFTNVTLTELAIRRYKVKKKNHKLYTKLTTRYNKLAVTQRELKQVSRLDTIDISESSHARLTKYIETLIRLAENNRDVREYGILLDRSVLGHSYHKDHRDLERVRKRIALLVKIQKELKYH